MLAPQVDQGLYLRLPLPNKYVRSGNRVPSILSDPTRPSVPRAMEMGTLVNAYL